MCLKNVTTNKPLIAEDDIERFKVLYKSVSEILISPHFCFAYMFDIVHDEPSFPKSIKASIARIGFHTFTTLNDAIKEKNDWHHPTDYVIARCVIPKGTPYFMGTFDLRNETVKSYCSKKIQMISIVY